MIVYPEKVNLTFDTVPTGLTLYLDGIAQTAPFVYDTLVGFNHTIEARNQIVGSNTYTFASWSDGGAQQHTIIVPPAAQTYTATYTVDQHAGSARVRAGQRRHAPDQPDHRRGDLHECAGWRATPTSWRSAGTTPPPTSPRSPTPPATSISWPSPTARGSGISQAIYYAKNIKAAAAGTNTVTVTFSAATAVSSTSARLEYSGLDPVNPFDVGASASGTSTSASSGAVTTTAARELIFGAGMTHAALHRRRARLHQPHHHPSGRRHRRGPLRHGDRKLQRDRVARRLRRMGHAGRHLQGRKPDVEPDTCFRWARRD